MFSPLKSVSFISCLCLVILSCESTDDSTLEIIEESPLNLPGLPFNYTVVNYPDHLNFNELQGQGQNAAVDNDNTPAENPTTNSGATLGSCVIL